MARESYLAFPFRIAPDGGVASADADAHVRQRVEQILFTSPGERVMLPEFGSGVRDLVFAANDAVLAAAAEFTIARALQQHLAGQVMVNAVTVEADEERLTIEVVYTHTRDLREQRVTFRVTPDDLGAAGRRAEARARG
jgi:uncharacterized protein